MVKILFVLNLALNCQGSISWWEKKGTPSDRRCVDVASDSQNWYYDKCMRLSSENGHSKFGVGFAPLSHFYFHFWFQQQKKIELKETLLNELQEKKKVIETERVSMELTGGQYRNSDTNYFYLGEKCSKTQEK